MFIDKELQFADGTWAPTTIGDNISTNVLDTGPLGGVPTANGGRDIGQGEMLTVVITVKTACTSGGAATVDFRLRTDSNQNLLTSPVDMIATGPQPYANLVAGKQFFLRIPPGTYKQYIGIDAVIATAALTAGAFECDIVKDAQLNTKYAPGFTVS